MTALVWIAKIVVVIGLLVFAAVLATPRGRLPLALRGLKKIIDRDRGTASSEAVGTAPSPLKRTLAFVFVILALLVAVL